jgi:hypothetical protein
MLVPERMSTIILAKTTSVGITSRPVFALLVPEQSSSRAIACKAPRHSWLHGNVGILESATYRN